MSRSIESTATFASRCTWLRAIVIALAAFASARFATAQVFINGMVTTEDSDEASSDDLKKPFIFPGKSNESGEAMADFQRYSKRGTWEKAFRALEKVVSAQTAGLAAGKDGLMIPSSVLIQQTLADLPATGKDAYRLFHDADAKGLLEKAHDRDELEKLKLVATAYLFTSVGDTAAERLGDYYFEQGELDRAAAAWRSVLVHRPDSAIPRARLLVKTAIALARDKRWLAFDEIRKQVDERCAADLVELGGQKVAAGEQLKKLADERNTVERPKTAEASIASTGSAELLPPADAESPLWRFRLVGKTPSTARQLAGWVGQGATDDETKSHDTVPSIVIGDGRLYANYIGCYVAIDLETGKLLWKTGKFEGKIRTMRQYGFYAPEQFPLTLVKDRLWSTSREVDTNGRVNQQFHLFAHEAATGKEVFNSKTITDLQSWNITSAPLVTDDAIYVTASPTNQGMQISLLALSPSDGKIRWQTPLGSTKVDGRNNYYAARMARPSLLARGPKIYVDTNAGGFVEVDRERGELNWGVVYELEQPYQRRMWYEPVYKARWSSAPLFYEGTLFFKGMGSGRLYAVDPAGPTIEWKRSVADSSMLVGVDADRVYLDGEELSAIDRATKKMVWSRRLPASSSFVWPLLTENRIYRMTPRGIFEVDKKTGHVERVFRGADTDTLGGSLALTPKALLAVSNLGITAYPLPDNNVPDNKAPESSDKSQATKSDAAGSGVESNTATTAK